MNQPKQKSAEWFKQRKGRVTGSNVGAALNLNPYKTPDDLIRQMVREYHGAEPEFVSNVATEWGSFNEEGAQAEYTMETGNAVEECGFFVHPEHEWLGASPDGKVNGYGVLEIKCPFGQRVKNPPTFKSAKEQEHYFAQMQIEMACTGAQYCDFYQWAPHGSKLEYVQRDDEWLAWVIPEIKAFHDRYLSELDNPDHLAPKRVEIETLKAEKLVQEHEELTDAIDRASERKKEVMAELVKLSGERNAIVCGHKLTKVERKGSVAYAKVVAKHCPDVDLEKWRGKRSTSWRLT